MELDFAAGGVILAVFRTLEAAGTFCAGRAIVADTGVDAFIGVAGEAERGVDWLRGPPGVGLEVVENENIVELL